MADGVYITSGSGVTIATDDDGAMQHQYIKVEFGGDGTFTKVTNAVPLPISGTTIAITSLPDIGLGSSIKVTSLPDLGLNSSVKITSLPDLGLNSSVKITSLPALAVGSIVSVSGLTSAIVSISNLPLQVSGTTIAITSLPDLGLNSSVKITSLPALAAGTIVSVSGLTSAIVSISNFSTTLQLVSGTTIAITSLPPIPIHSISNGAILSISAGALVSISNSAVLSISGLTSAIVSISNLPIGVLSTVTNAGTFLVQHTPVTGYWKYTSTYTSAQTNVVLVALSGSTTAHYITDVIFANNSTQGNLSLVESRSNAAIRPILAPMFFQPYGGAVINFQTPLVLDTNSAIVMTSQTVTAHSVTITGYTR